MTEISPDVVPLVDLTLLDLTPQDLVDQAVLDAQTKWTDWTPREGNTEVVLLETQALMAAEEIYAVNRLPNAILAALLARIGLPALPGTAATVTLTFATSSVADITVPVGTRVRLAYDSSGNTLDFLTDTDLLIAGGTWSGTVSATADTVGAAANGVAAGDTTLIDAIAGVDNVTIASQILGGVDPETLDAYLTRGGTLLRRLTSTLVLPEHFEIAALENTAVMRCRAYDLYDPAAGGSPGDNPGHTTVAVAGPGGTPLTGAVKADLQASLQAQAQAALVVHIVDATITAVDVTCSVTLAAGADSTTVQAAVAAAVEAYLDPDQWAFAGTVYRNELISLVDHVAGVDRVVDVTTPAGDTALAGVAPLAKAGVVTVNVVAG